MPIARPKRVATQNNFSKGLLTEFTGLNYPEDACTETSNCVFERVGRVTRRGGFDIDSSNTPNNVNADNVAIATYQWKNPNGDGTKIILVKQIGSSLYFYDASNPINVEDLASHILPTGLNLITFRSEGNVTDPSPYECQFAAGYGFLFVFHPHCDPFYVEFDGIGGFAGTKITLSIRDFKGILPPADVAPDSTTRDTGLSISHAYNLGNQGWTSPWVIASSTANSFSGGSHEFFVDTDSSLVPNITVGKFVRITYSGNFAAFMRGTITFYSGNHMFISVSEANNPGGVAPDPVGGWFITEDPDNIHQVWANVFSNFPANTDIWWRYKDINQVFSPKDTFTNITQNTSPAPRGHYILEAFYKKRSKVSSVIGLTDEVTFVRPATGAFYAGRVWYTGVLTPEYSNTIFFSQVIENRNPLQFGKCYQSNDPTSEDFFDLLPTDGGTIVVQNADNIYKLWPTQNALLVFAGNGVWAITGSQGIGFTANDYSIQKLDNIPSIGASSFVDFKGLPMWWNNNGIYTVEFDSSKGFGIKSLTATSIDTYFNTFPNVSKQFARGAYNKSTYLVQWLVRSTNESGSITNRYRYDTILTFNTVTGAWYPWTVTTGSLGGGTNVYLHGVTMLDTEGSPLSAVQVGVDPVFKYLVSYQSGGGFNQFLFAEERNFTDYSDWKLLKTTLAIGSTGVNYNSYFISGYRVHADAIRKIQNMYIQLYNEIPVPISYAIQGIWDYAKNGNSGRFTSQEVRDLLPSNYSIRSARHKIRGQGYSLQYKLQSVGNKPFYIIGWAAQETASSGL